MTILALETTGDLCSIAIRDSAGTLVERLFRHRMHLSERIVGDVDSVLKDAGLELADIDCLAVDIGPGSFTGVRLGVMTAKTWADTLGKPIIAINALEALAAESAPIYRGIVVPTIRARPGAIYGCAYRCAHSAAEPLGDPALMTFDELAAWISTLQDTAPLIVGDALKRSSADIQLALFAHGIQPVLGGSDAPRASIIAAIAEHSFASGLLSDPLALVPLYISPPPIDPRAEIKPLPPDP
jgi:tRNA threonylcarbamoyladenosine biosynthesis protein TsaB